MAHWTNQNWSFFINKYPGFEWDEFMTGLSPNETAIVKLIRSALPPIVLTINAISDETGIEPNVVLKTLNGLQLYRPLRIERPRFTVDGTLGR